MTLVGSIFPIKPICTDGTPLPYWHLYHFSLITFGASSFLHSWLRTFLIPSLLNNLVSIFFNIIVNVVRYKGPTVWILLNTPTKSSITFDVEVLWKLCLQFWKLDEIVHLMNKPFDENPFWWKPVLMKTHSTLSTFLIHYESETFIIDLIYFQKKLIFLEHSLQYFLSKILLPFNPFGKISFETVTPKLWREIILLWLNFLFQFTSKWNSFCCAQASSWPLPLSSPFVRVNSSSIKLSLTCFQCFYLIYIIKLTSVLNIHNSTV